MPTGTSRPTLALAAVLLAAAFWGSAGTAAAYIPDANPLAIGAVGLGIGGVLQALFAIGHREHMRRILKQHSGVLWLSAVSVAIEPLAFYSSMHYAGVAVGSMVSLASAPIASGILDWVTHRQRPTRHWLLAVALGVLGGSLLILQEGGTTQSPRPVLGFFLGLLTGTTYALYAWGAHRLMAAGERRAPAMGAIFGVAGVLLLGVAAIVGTQGLFNSPLATAMTLYTVLVPMLGGYLLFGYALQHLRASTVTTITLIQPAISALLAVAVVGERLVPLSWTGMALLGAALVALALEPPDAEVLPGTATAPS